MDKSVVLLNMDGWGLSSKFEGNAFKVTKPGFLSEYWLNFPHVVLRIKKKDFGQSYTCLGAGRPVKSQLDIINEGIETGDFYNNVFLKRLFSPLKNGKNTLHLVGMISKKEGEGIIKHLQAVYLAAKMRGVTKIALHLITDGLSEEMESALPCVKKIENFLKKEGLGDIVSISGRFYAMDKTNHLDRTRRAFRAQMLGEGIVIDKATQALERAYKKGYRDDILQPMVMKSAIEEDLVSVKDGDVVFFTNYKRTGLKQLLKLYIDAPGLSANYRLVSLVDYGVVGIESIIGSEQVEDSLSEIISKAGINQLKVFENDRIDNMRMLCGNQQRRLRGEDILNIKIDSLGLKQEKLIWEKSILGLESMLWRGRYGFTLVDFPVLDNLAQSQDFNKINENIIWVEEMMQKICSIGLNAGALVFITACKGGLEQIGKEKPDNEILVPLVVVNDMGKWFKDKSLSADLLAQLAETKRSLADVAPTVLDYLGLEVPKKMIGESLLYKSSESEER
jgi:2,3-bisphosphoglycerate-independent phosphoglycerate mutase